jgi:antirestriction protein ArdC
VKSQAEIRKHVTEQIIESLKSGGLPPWRKSWSDDPNAPGLHTSLSTGKPYRGINQLILQCSAMQGGFKSKWWGTFNQVRQNNSFIRKGQKGTHVVLWKPISRKRVNEDGDETDENFLVMREFVVFNAEQTTGLKQFQVGFSKPKGNPIERYEEADHVIDSTNARIEYGGNQPCYRPHDDVIQLPFRHQYNTPEDFYETAFHELLHWTAKEGRAGWKGDFNYAFCELVAEIGACYLMGELGLPTGDTLPNSAAYVKGWLQGMFDDHRFIFSASSQASKAADFILSFSRKEAEKPETVLAE